MAPPEAGDRSEETTAIDLAPVSAPARGAADDTPTAVETPLGRRGGRRRLLVTLAAVVAVVGIAALERRGGRREAPAAWRELRRGAEEALPAAGAGDRRSATPEAEALDYTDAETVARLVGRWRVETPEGPTLATLTGVESAVRRDGQALLRLYGAASIRYPALYTVVRLPDGGTFLGFWRDGRFEEVWDDLVLDAPDRLSFQPAGGGPRRVAVRLGPIVGR